jgi:hypothetical protein
VPCATSGVSDHLRQTLAWDEHRQRGEQPDHVAALLL